MEIGEVKIEWLGHSGFLIQNSKVIYVDPFEIREGLPKADIILITHGHYDHCSVKDIEKIIQEGTRILVTADAQSKIARFETPVRMEVVTVGEDYDFGSVKVSTVPAYNTDKTFHTKEEGLVGYVVKTHGVIIYHAGDTDHIPEMEKLSGYNQNFIALLPVSGRYVMTAEEAAEAASVIKPTIAIPMHYGAIVGEKEDAEEFKELCEENSIRCEILEKY